MTDQQLQQIKDADPEQVKAALVRFLEWRASCRQTNSTTKAADVAVDSILFEMA